jgi:Zn ribbon nucleic-acid-binding protein
MAYLRCTACGAKALRAATQCPRCTVPFALSDAQGRRVALRECRGCGYLHRVDTPCHWCGVLPPPAWRQPAVRRRVAVAVVTLMAAGAGWGAAASGRLPGLGDRAPVARPALVAETPVAETPVAEAPMMAATVLPVAETAPDGGVPTAPVAAAGAPPAASPAAPPAASPAARDSVRWVSAVARTWVNVRRDASRDGEVVGVIKPESRAWLEHGRAGWRRVRAQDVRGWVDPRLFEADSVARRGG